MLCGKALLTSSLRTMLPMLQPTKCVPITKLRQGINALETAFSSVFALVNSKKISLVRLIESLTTRPASILGRDLGRLRKGFPADITLIHPSALWVVDPSTFASKSVNTPLAGVEMTGRVVRTIYQGKTVFQSQPEVRKNV